MKIKNVEEKMLIMGCYKCSSNKSVVHLFDASGFYHSWINKWEDDFLLNGRHLQIFRDKFVKSANQARKKQKPPEAYKEYQDFLDHVIDRVKSQYNRKLMKKHNLANYKKLLIQYREECLDDLVKKCNMVFDGKYYVAVIKQKINNLAIYAIYDENNTDIFQGNYEDTLSFMESVRKMKE